MITFNQEKYIHDAIKGVLIQKCKFPIEIIISEDCSNDRTRQICQEYASKNSAIRLISSDSNVGMLPNFFRTIKSSQGKYVAFCEGDDYWIDPLKLQKQVDFLETNPRYGLVHTDYYKYHQNIKRFERDSVLKVRDLKSKTDYNDLLKMNVIQTLTVCLRKSVLKQYFLDIQPEIRDWLLGDYPVWLYFAKHSKIHYIPEKTAVYRLLPESATFSLNRGKELRFLESVYSVSSFYINKYGCNDGIKEELRRNYLRDLTRSRINIGYDLRKSTLIQNSLEEKRKNSINITILDIVKLVSSSNSIVWHLSRFFFWLKRYADRYSFRYITKVISINTN